jgi:hypothetical protein
LLNYGDSVFLPYLTLKKFINSFFFYITCYYKATQERKYPQAQAWLL